jgi:hypothetical protein
MYQRIKKFAAKVTKAYVVKLKRFIILERKNEQFRKYFLTTYHYK